MFIQIKGASIMKSKNAYVVARMAASLCIILTVLLSSSMAAFATTVKPVGELIVTGTRSEKAVTVNGEPAASGRTIFAASTITTPEGMTAVLDFGKAGKIELAPNTTYSFNADGSLSGSLTAGSAKVLSASDAVGIKTLTGDVVTLNAGDMVAAESATAKKQDDDDDDDLNVLIPTLVFAGIVGIAVVYVLTNGDDDAASPVR